MICYWCYWGWPKAIADIYKDFVDDWDDSLLYGPAHCVWADENFDAAEEVLESFETDRIFYESRFSRDEIEFARLSLERLCKIPIEDRTPPNNYLDEEDNDPEDFPPPGHWQCQK